ncbi:MAG: hypothetical protein MZW92_02675 [Comamonadaceae bacterium]|nr:hypothetical protein [Comamonadaceae bacterium]
MFFHPETGDYSIKVFASLIQSDGYNPLGINGSTFEIADKAKIAPLAVALLRRRRGGDDSAPFRQVHPRLDRQRDGAEEDPKPARRRRAVLGRLRRGDAEHRGVVERRLLDRPLDLHPRPRRALPRHLPRPARPALLFDDRSYRTFESPISVRPRLEKHAIDKSGALRQYGALRHPDQEKIARLGLNEHGTNWFSAAGSPFATNLYAKLLILAANKFATLDPEGLGVEMEANRPGWNDAMNGLPGIFGSGMSETVELGRLARFLKNALRETLPAGRVRHLRETPRSRETGPRVRPLGRRRDDPRRLPRKHPLRVRADDRDRIDRLPAARRARRWRRRRTP